MSIDHAFRGSWNNGTNIFLVSVAKSTNDPFNVFSYVLVEVNHEQLTSGYQIEVARV